MELFVIRFFLCNLLIAGIVGLLLAARRLFRRQLTSRMRYHLWFLLLTLLAVPFLPIRFETFRETLSRAAARLLPSAETAFSASGALKPLHSPGVSAAAWMEDFTLSVSRQTPSALSVFLLLLWICGMLAMALFLLRSRLHLRALKRSALPLQNENVKSMYARCLRELGIKKDIPVCSTAWLRSPVLTGLFHPCIYLPIRLISEAEQSGSADLRYILLHELAHYRHRDTLVNELMNLAGIFYWFHPFVWLALREMRDDREMACDASVLDLLGEDACEDYGDTLIRFAGTFSTAPFPFSSALSGSMRQLRRRIANIASYEKTSPARRLRGAAVFLLIAALLVPLAPALSTHAFEEDHYSWPAAENAGQPGNGQISQTDLSGYFGSAQGSFVLYDAKEDHWTIHNMDAATRRVSPDSTWKIYDALLGLEHGVIAPEQSNLSWDGQTWPFEEWNRDQDLASAMAYSVNWYFHSIDQRLGAAAVSDFLHDIGYGNEDMSGGLSSYWMESTLKISPVEQVELLIRFRENDLGFDQENIDAVKETLRLSSATSAALYGKTGTGRVEGADVNGWFVGYLETSDNVWYFAANIQDSSGATGSRATEITENILRDLGILISESPAP